MSGGSKLGRGASGLAVLLLALGGGLLLALSPDIALPLAVMLLPGLLALLLDRSPGCGMARAILLFQGAASVHPVMDAWYRCAGMDGCMSYLGAWPAILPVWLAAAVGWLMTQVLPLAIKLLDDYRLRHRRASLITQREHLVKEWGFEDPRG